MEIKSVQDEEVLTMSVSGRLDTNAAPALLEELENTVKPGVEKLVIDLEGLVYIASSGLRAVITAQKKMNALGGSMVVKNVRWDVMEVFEMTGFTDILTFE